MISRPRVMIFISLAAVLLFAFIFYTTSRGSSPSPQQDNPFESKKKPDAVQSSDSGNKETEGTVMVDIKGAVKQPGVYAMDKNKRVMDAVKEAGGFTGQAAVDMVNLAQRVQDEMIIMIPREGELETAQPSAPQAGHGSASGSSRVNINTADQTELETLPGIGPSKAEAIIKHREENGPFSAPEQITEVSGIGEKTFENLKDEIQAP